MREKVKGVVYKVDCSCGSTYVGETGRTLEVRMKEHKRAVRMDQANNGIELFMTSKPFMTPYGTVLKSWRSRQTG